MDRKIERKIRDTLQSVPGYRGYRSLEDRRDDDRRVREQIADEISASGEFLTRAGASAVQARVLGQISAIESLVGQTRSLADRVRSASYGYGGLFGSRNVGANVLDQIRQFDDAFLAESGSLRSLAEAIAEAKAGEADLEPFGAELRRLETLFAARSKVVDTAEPEADPEVLNLLEPPTPVNLSPVASVARGDALSILGDNYIVDAIVRIGEGDDAVTMARLGQDDDGNYRWLLGGNTAKVTTALLTQTSETTAPIGAASKRGTAMIQTAEDSQYDVPVHYGLEGDSGTGVRFWYTIGGDTRVLTGNPVVDQDVQVYGQA